MRKTREEQLVEVETEPCQVSRSNRDMVVDWLIILEMLFEMVGAHVVVENCPLYKRVEDQVED